MNTKINHFIESESYQAHLLKIQLQLLNKGVPYIVIITAFRDMKLYIEPCITRDMLDCMNDKNRLEIINETDPSDSKEMDDKQKDLVEELSETIEEDVIEPDKQKSKTEKKPHKRFKRKLRQREPTHFDIDEVSYKKYTKMMRNTK
ncbi:hypothetical protein QTN25_004723 [Entamoeba marina]